MSTHSELSQMVADQNVMSIQGSLLMDCVPVSRPKSTDDDSAGMYV